MKTVVLAYRTEGVEGIKALARNGFEITGVYTRPESKSDYPYYASVADYCREAGLPCQAPPDFNDLEVIDRIDRDKPEFIFSFGVTKLLASRLISIPPRGSYKLHLSKLPAYRGPHPVRRALVRNERFTGVTFHQMVEQADAGDIIGQREVTIEKEDDVLSLYNKLVTAGGSLLEEHLPLLKEGKAPRRPMDVSSGSYFSPWRENEGRIDWSMSSWEVYNLVRALTRPNQGAFTTLQGENMTIWRAVPDDTAPGLLTIGEFDVDEDKLYVGTRYGQLRLDEVEWKGQILSGPEVARELGPRWRNRFR